MGTLKAYEVYTYFVYNLFLFCVSYAPVCRILSNNVLPKLMNLKKYMIEIQH